MRKYLCLCLQAFFLVVIHPAYAAAYDQPANLGDKIVAVVNEDVITQSDLDVSLASAIAELKKEYSGSELSSKVDEAKRDFLNQMIEDKLILQEAKRRGVTCDDSEIEERLSEIKSKFHSDTDFEVEIEKAGITVDILKARYKDQVMMNKLVTHEVKDKIVVTPAEISDYYNKHLDELKAPESVRLKSVMIRFDEATTEPLAKQKADDIVRFIKEGRDFSDLAKQYSQGPKAEEGGDLGFIEKGQMREEFDKVIFALKPGEISPPIKTDTGYYIFKVEEKKDGYTRPLAEAHDEIESMIFREKGQARYKDWIAKLKRDAFIQIK